MNQPAWLRSAHHDGSERYVSKLHPRLGETVRLRLRVAQAAPVRRVLLRTFPDGEQALTAMALSQAEPFVQWWQADLLIDEPLAHYRFVIEAADGLWHYSAAGPSAHVPLDYTDFRILADYDPPGWPAESVFYQIFPDRFARSPHVTPPGPLEPWETPPNFHGFKGGDLLGIAERLDELADLGRSELLPG